MLMELGAVRSKVELETQAAYGKVILLELNIGCCVREF